MQFLPHPRNTFLRHCVAVISLLAFVAAITGLPAPIVVGENHGKDVSQPFPCMFSRCGCRNAEACWRACCCRTNAEKIAWAKQNDVTAPAYVIAAAAKEVPVVAKPSCCSHSQPVAANFAKTKTCCSETSAPKVAVAACCQKKNTTPAPAVVESKSISVASPTPWTFVISIAARKCQGLPQIWLTTGAVTTLVRVELPQDDTVNTFQLPSLLRPLSPCYTPEAPPPRSV